MNKNFLCISLGVAKTSWRITVRQLESMIRLSEGMARMYCQDTVRLVLFCITVRTSTRRLP